MTKYQLKPKIVEARWWDATKGWTGFEELAEWCNGTVSRDNNPMNTEKAYYWYIQIPGHTQSYHPHVVILRLEDGTYEVLDRDEFTNKYEKV